jgi:phenylpyruvate tautomerase PptA (4-oxalocrotonate tautomerase family)
MNDRLFEALDICLKAWETGIPIEDCLKLYPEMASELRPLLEIAQDAGNMTTKQVPVDAMYRSRTKLLARAMQLRTSNEQSKQHSFLSWLILPIRSIKRMSISAGRLVFAAMIAILLVLTSGGLLVTSAKSLPGDTLYPVKRAVEDIGYHLAPRGEIQQTFEHNYIQQRITEVQSLINLKRVQQVSFEGIIESKDRDQWIVGGIPVDIQSNTTFVGGLDGTQSMELGMQVEVEGVTQREGWVDAQEIHLREYHFIGMVESISASKWQISGIEFQTVTNTQIDSGILVGDDVTVLVRSEDNGLFALAIVRMGHPVPTPSIIPTITPTPTQFFENPSENNAELVITGSVELMAVNYWVISGQITYIVANTEVPDSIQIGDYVSAHVVVESNGSYTAIVIEKVEPSDHNGGGYNQATPENNEGEDDRYVTPTPSPDDDAGNETPEITTTPFDNETPESTDDHEEPEDPTETPTLPPTP